MDLYKPMVWLALAGFAACGGDDGVEVPTDGVAIAGGTVNHSMNRLATEQGGASPSFSKLTLAILDGSMLSAAPLVSGDQPASGCETSGACKWSLIVDDLTGVSAGLAGRVTDNREDPIWIPTITGFGNAASVDAAVDAHIFNGGKAFAVSRESVNRVVSSLVGLSGDEIMARGVIFGLVYGGISSDGSGEPISGATVVANTPNVTIVYPNDKFTGTASATTQQGAFIAVPSAVGAVTETSFTVTDGSHTWDATQPAYVIPNTMYFTLMFAQ